MSAPARAKRLMAAVRAEPPDIVEPLGLEETADDPVERAERFATLIADIIVDLVDRERVRRGLPPLK